MYIYIVFTSTTFPSFQNHKFACDLPHPSSVYMKAHLMIRHFFQWFIMMIN